MEKKVTEHGQELQALPEEPIVESKASAEVEALRAENERLWHAVEQYAPQVVDMLVEQEDVRLLADVARRLSSSTAHQPPPQSEVPPTVEPLQDVVSDLARQMVDSLFDSGPVQPPSSSLGIDTAHQRDERHMEEYFRQQAVRRSVVERGSAERREPAIALDPKGKEIARAFGISEDKLAQAAAERLRRKGVLRS